MVRAPCTETNSSAPRSVKSHQQQADHACGTAVVRNLLDYYGLPVLTERTLLRHMNATFEDGIDPHDMARYLNSIGLEAKVHINGKLRDLQKPLLRRVFPIIVWQDWGGHYVMVVGYMNGDRNWPEGRFLLADPAASYDGRPDGWTYTSGSRLKALWVDRYKGKEIKGLYITVEKPEG